MMGLLKIIPVRVSGPATYENTFALLDEGSTVTLMDKTLARRLGCRGPRTNISIAGIGARETIYENCEKVEVEIHGSFRKHQIKNAIVVPELNLPSQSVPVEITDQLKQTCEAAIEPYYHARVKILLGQDNWRLITSRELRETEVTDLAISRTLLGWVAHGRANKSLVANADGACMAMVNKKTILEPMDEEYDSLDRVVREYIYLDNLGVNAPKDNRSQNRNAWEILENTTRKTNGAWETGLLWNGKPVPACNGRSTALTRLASLEKRLDKSPSYAKLFYAEMERLISKGYLVKVTRDTRGARKWYLPIFGVRNVNKPDKIRIVADAAAKTGGISLNDQLEPGPDLLQSLPGVIIRYRQKRIAITADSEDMFLRIQMREQDRPAQTIVWRGADRLSKPTEYEWASLLFGATSSPCSAIFVKDKNASRFNLSKPRAAKSIVKNGYMDDYMASVDEEEEAIELAQDVIHINSEANFRMHRWASNSSEVLKQICTVEETEGAKDTQLGDRDNERILGLYWYKKSDTLSFNVGLNKIPSEILNGRDRPTKRDLLKIVMSVFDPLGLLSPFTIKAKILMQDVWRSGISWDSRLKDEQYANWLEWLEHLMMVRDCAIPRCYTPGGAKFESLQLHVFCDASLHGYAAVAYLRFERAEGTGHVSLIMAKTRVAPVKPLTVPRLELQAALLGSRLAKTVGDELELKIDKRFLWSDSTTVLQWLRSEPRKRQVYVANRLGEIGESTRVSEWRWVPGKENPADDATRWSKEPLRPTDRWFTGPTFLLNAETEWPKSKVLSESEKLAIEGMETRKEVVAIANEVIPSLLLARRLLGWEGLQVLARRIRRFFDKWRGKTHLNSVNCIVTENEEFWYRVIQGECFESEIDALKRGKGLRKGSKISGLKPFIDSAGILRASGRVTRILGANFENQPIILDAKHFAVKFILQSYHRKFFHGSTETVVNELRQRYHIVGLRRRLRSIVSRCITCRKQRGKPRNPLMSTLPAGRVAFRQRPFSHCGVDYFGPLLVKIGRRREKRWGVLFTCMATRAIHLELAHTLTASSTIMALQRLAARRGSPLTLYSDNGTNFTKANKELKEAVANLSREEQRSRAATWGIKWVFNPPSAPHMGGVWERLVRSVKTALGVVLRERAPSEEVLYTLLTEVEHSVNSRPLTHVSVDPRDNEALTPNHFLIGNSSGHISLDRYEATTFNPRKQFRLAQALADAFWLRWLREYLPTLLPRKKWHDEKPPPKTGDIVLIADTKLPRNAWRIGSITELYPGKDDIVRIAKIRVHEDELIRPVHKLIRILGTNEV